MNLPSCSSNIGSLSKHIQVWSNSIDLEPTFVIKFPRPKSLQNQATQPKVISLSPLGPKHVFSSYWKPFSTKQCNAPLTCWSGCTFQCLTGCFFVHDHLDSFSCYPSGQEMDSIFVRDGSRSQSQSPLCHYTIAKSGPWTSQLLCYK